MSPIIMKNITDYVENNIGQFHASRLAALEGIKLKKVLRKKNPYLYKAKNVSQVGEIINGILSAFVSSSEEGIFGNWLEQLAIFVNTQVYGGAKTGTEGIDLEFSDGTDRYLVTIKSGPDWGNDAQIQKMRDHFDSARRRFRTSGGNVVPVCVNGCCYGRSRVSSEYKKKGNYYKKCGQRFWELISGDTNLYKDLIVPIGHDAKAKNDVYEKSYGALVNKLSADFMADFTDSAGNIDWEKLVIFNSATF